MDPITELRSDLRRLEGRHPASPHARRDFLRFSVKLDTFIGAAVEMAAELPQEDTMPKGKGKETVHAVMHDFKEGTLHSGSKHGPKVTSRDQAVAIAMSEADKQRPKKGKR